MKFFSKSNLFKVSTLILLSGMWMTSCYYDKESDLPKDPDNNPTDTCDLSQAKYSLKIQKILADNCVVCHGHGLQEGNVRLDSHEKVTIQVNNGKLLKSISHQAGASPMPYGLPKMNDCNISMIEQWIKNGALND